MYSVHIASWFFFKKKEGDHSFSSCQYTWCFFASFKLVAFIFVTFSISVYKLTSLDGSYLPSPVGVAKSNGLLFCVEQVGVSGCETAIKMISISKIGNWKANSDGGDFDDSYLESIQCDRPLNYRN